MCEVQGLIAQKDPQYKDYTSTSHFSDAHRKMRCGRELSNVRTPHRISADLNLLTSAHTRFANLNYLTSAHHTTQNGVSFSSSKPCTPVSDTMSLSISLRKSTPPQNLQLDILRSNCEQ